MLPLRPALLAAALVAANLVHADVPASAPFTAAQQHVIQQLSASEVRAAVPKIASEAASSVAKTIEGEKQAIEVAKDTLEVGRKSVDWWLTALGLLMAVAGIGLPIWLSRKHDQVEIKLKEADTAKQKAEIALRHAEQLVESFSKQTSLIPSADDITGKLSTEVLEKLHKVKPPQVVTLIEQAWDAHRRKDWKTAKPLWELLSLIEGHDHNVWFNLGLTLVHTNQDWETAASYFQRSYLLEPTAKALHNWGKALSDLASSFSDEKKDLYFVQAFEKFAEADRLRPDHALTYNNWGAALAKYAETLSGSAKREYLVKACDKFTKAIKCEPESATAYKWKAFVLEALAKFLEGAELEDKLNEAAELRLKAEEMESQTS
ncbi:hypothetical protein [Vogesella indigofera]|uniref:hypothetical protein n=1 Tax=Vogesella indigofera TaxID=45465 RepID=UPI003F423271